MFKVLVTGSSGFVGKNLVETLSLKKHLVYEAFYDKEKKIIHRVRKFNNKEIEPLIDYENIKKIDAIIHCAAKLPSSKNNEINNLDEYKKVNVEQTLLTAKQAVKKGIKRFVYLSSALVVNDKQLINNTTKSFYSISKLESEIALMEFSKQTGLEVVILRPPLIYGKYVKGNFINLLDLIYKKIPLPFKNIKNLRSYIGVNNLIDLIIVCISHPKAVGKIFSASDNEDISISDLIIKISKFMNLSPKLFSLPTALLKSLGYLFFSYNSFNSIIQTFHCSNEDVNKILGWSPVYSLDQEIEKLVHWYKKNR
jgi:nucleoside-diphosphate-sugar epimerase